MSLSKRIFSLLPEFIQEIYSSYKSKIQTFRWNRSGKMGPVPHAIKQEIIVRYKNKYNISTLVESGTYMGDMVWAQRNNFNKIYSIELDKELFSFSKRRFKKNPHIMILSGDSGKIMPTLIKELSEKSIFWLDGHYSGGITARGEKDSPIIDEIKAILSSKVDHILIIDDARDFTGQRDYPSIEGLSAYILQSHPTSAIHVENDVIIVELGRKHEEDKLEDFDV